MQPNDLASKNFEAHLRHNPYPGRGFVIGRTERDDGWYIVYWIMGRSEQSRNRKFVVEEGVLMTQPIDAALVANPELIIYEAMLELPGRYLVSNGKQTRILYDMLQGGGTFDAALAQQEREPDAPHYTPRISGLLDIRNRNQVSLTLSILKANQANAEMTDRFTFRPAMPPAGFGMGLTTYCGNGNPLPSFSGDPLLLPCKGSAQDILDTYWHALNSENRIALAIKYIPAQEGHIAILIHNCFGNEGK